jgi:hypothetical protein
MRQNAHEAASPDEPPAVATVVGEQLDSIFAPGSLPHYTQISPRSWWVPMKWRFCNIAPEKESMNNL